MGSKEPFRTIFKSFVGISEAEKFAHGGIAKDLSLALIDLGV